MKNVHAFTGATSWDHKGLNDKSGPNKNLSAHGRPTEVKPTSMDHFKPTPRSGEGYAALGHTGTQMGEPYAMSSDRSEKPVLSKAGKNDKSEPKPPAEP